MRLRLIACVLLLASLYATSAMAKDYERNDVSSRELGVLLARTSFASAPFATLVRGVARRHTRFFYVATEVMLGTTFKPAFYGSLGGAMGIESAEDAYQPVRGYLEVGVTGQWSQSSIFELLNIHLESGVRLQLKTTVRPHMYAHAGARLMTSFKTYGLGLTFGVGWTFD